MLPSLPAAVIGQLSSELDVFVSVRPKAKQPVQSVIIKSIEQNIQCVYEVGVALCARCFVRCVMCCGVHGEEWYTLSSIMVHLILHNGTPYPP